MNTETESTHHLLQQVLVTNLYQNEVIVRTKLIYFRESHKSEVLYNQEPTDIHTTSPDITITIFKGK